MTSAPIAELHSLTPELVKAGGEITAAFIAALVAISGWFIGHNLTRRREDRTKRLQIALEHCEKQIAEFYAPLNGLLTQLDTTAKILVEMVDKEPQKTAILQRLVYFKYFLPLHRENRKNIEGKITSVGGLRNPRIDHIIPKTFCV